MRLEVILVSVLAVACSDAGEPAGTETGNALDDDDDASSGPECATDAECVMLMELEGEHFTDFLHPEQVRCIEGQCSECQSDADCDEYERCAGEQRCWALPRCETAADCADADQMLHAGCVDTVCAECSSADQCLPGDVCHIVDDPYESRLGSFCVAPENVQTSCLNGSCPTYCTLRVDEGVRCWYRGPDEPSDEDCNYGLCVADQTPCSSDGECSGGDGCIDFGTWSGEPLGSYCSDERRCWAERECEEDELCRGVCGGGG